VVPCGEDQITPNGWWFRLRLRHCCRLSASAAVTGITCEIPCPLSPYAFGGNRLAHQPAGIYIMDGIRALAESRGFTLSVKKPWFSFHLIKQLDSDVKKKVLKTYIICQLELLECTAWSISLWYGGLHHHTARIIIFRLLMAKMIDGL
jgi:hypothetical protein